MKIVFDYITEEGESLTLHVAENGRVYAENIKPTFVDMFFKPETLKVGNQPIGTYHTCCKKIEPHAVWFEFPYKIKKIER